MTVGLGGAGLIVGLLLGLQNYGTWAVTALLLLGAFYAGAWLNSPYHSVLGDALFLLLAAIPAYFGAALGFVVGQHLPTRRT
jgi:uncharacterized membrane protein